MMKSMCP